MKAALCVFVLLAGSVAVACPDLSGSFVCRDSITGLENDFDYSQFVNSDGYTVYTSGGDEIVADGVVRYYSSTGYSYQWSAACAGEKFVILTEGDFDDNGDPIHFLIRSEQFMNSRDELIEDIYDGDRPIQTFTCTRK